MKVKIYQWIDMPSDGLNLYLEGNQSWEMTFIKEKKNIQIAEIRKDFGDTIFLVISYNNQFNHIYTWETGVGASTYWELPTAETTIRYTANNKTFGIDGYKSVELANNATYTKLLYRNTEDTNIKVKSIKTDTLHLVPCLTSDNEACMIDLLSGELYKNQGSGAFSVEGEMLYEFETTIIKQVMRKPNVVVRLRESIISNNVNNYGAWIDTNIINSSKVDAEVKFTTRNVLFGRSGLFGNSGKVQNTNRLSMSVEKDWDGNPICWRGAVPPEVNRYIGIESGTHIARINKREMILDGVTIWTNATPREWNDGTHLYLCKNAIVSTTDLCETASIQYCKIWEDGVLVRNLHPCDLLHHPTLPPQSCMIDLNTGDLYTNQGTGSFTCEGEDLGIWTDTLFDDMRIKDVKADMVVVKHNGEPRVVYERTQPFVEHRWLRITDDAKSNFRIYIQQPINKSLRHITRCNLAINAAICVVNNIGYYYTTRGSNIVLITTRDIVTQSNENLFEISDKVYVNSVDKGIEVTSKSWASYADSNSPIDLMYRDVVLDGNTLTPIQLTRNLFPHEIASSNTALQGECGFADKDKYKRGEPWFYGNRATSGSFSVSDEE